MNRLLDIIPASLLSELGGNPSFLCLSTAEIKYLIFSDDSDSPVFVIQPGTERELTELKSYTAQLYSSLPDRIPEPIAIVNDHDQHYLIQHGIAGVPWFTLRHRIGKEMTWEKLVEQSTEALGLFHTATSSNDEWVKQVSLTDLFTELHDQVVQLGSDIPGIDQAIFTEIAAQLDKLGFFPYLRDCEYEPEQFNVMFVNRELINTDLLEDIAAGFYNELKPES